MLVEIVLGPFDIWLNRVCVLGGIPIGGANFAVFLDELKSFQQSKGFVHGTTHGQIVHSDLPQDTFRVDDEQSSQGDSSILEQNVVVPSDLFRQVCEQGVLQLTQSSVLSFQIRPCQVAEMRVHRHSNDFCIQGLELIDAVTEGDDLGGTNECTGRERIYDRFQGVFKGTYKSRG